MSTISALRRSFDVYYRDMERTARMDHMNASLVPSGGLIFDIGAHVGDRTGSFVRLGASVVSFEPQPRVFRALRLIYGRTPTVTLRNEAVGAHPGTLDFYINAANPTVSTASQDLIDAAQTASGWQGQNWDTTVQVPVTTLDRLINEFGEPDFVKIDVEGFELEVLKGLSVPLPLLSFEFTTIQRDIAEACIDRVNQLGAYEFNYSLGEDHSFASKNWIDAAAIRSQILQLPHAANSGDIFARRLS